MGADIHFYTERKTSSNNYQGPRDIQKERNIKIEEVIEGKPIEERWVSADTWQKNSDYWKCNEIYNNRNYYLFSILADVRNDGSVKPIDDPRGIPKDCSSGYKYMCDMWNGDAHSHSYFTLTELLEIDWDYYEKDYIRNFLETIEKMKQIDANTDKVRCVFFFDN